MSAEMGVDPFHIHYDLFKDVDDTLLDIGGAKGNWFLRPVTPREAKIIVISTPMHAEHIYDHFSSLYE